MTDLLDSLQERHRALNRQVDNCRAAGRQEELKMAKRSRLRLKDRIALLRQRIPAGE